MRISNVGADYDNKPKALDGIRVLEWSQLVAGPYCTKLLADLGAETIKIEKPNVGDIARHLGPFIPDIVEPEGSLLFLNLNTNKMGITLDIENQTDRQRFMELIQWADILIEDNSPRILEELHLTYVELKKHNPRLVMTSITPFGQTGPYRDYKAYPLNIYHGGGLGYISPKLEDYSTQAPLKAGAFFSEYACGLVGAVGTLAALYYQQSTGIGQHVDISKQEAIAGLVRVQIARYPNEGVIQTRFDNPLGAPRMFQCSNGYIVWMGNQSHEWQAFAKLVGNSEWEHDERYLDTIFRSQHGAEINKYVAEWMADKNKEEVYHQGQALGCPITPIMTAKDIADSAQSAARHFFIEVPHPIAGKLKYPAAPYQFSATPAEIEHSAPLLGQHNEEVFNKIANLSKSTKLSSNETRIKGTRSVLQGIRIADFSWMWAGAYATELLAFLGAEVIRVESMKHIDFTRISSFTTGQKFENINKSSVFNDINLGKLSIRLNLSKSEGVEIARKLVRTSDIVVQNMRPGVMDRLGLGYESLKKIKPDIIYLSSSARGAIGPERLYAGYAPNFAAWGGISYVTGVSGDAPSFMTGEIDLLSAITSTVALLVALTHRLNTGEGQHIDLSSAEAINVLLGDSLMDYTANGKIQTRQGNIDDFMAPHNCYRCKGEDKWISIAIATDEEWGAFSKVLGNPAWTEEPQFASAVNRWKYQAQLDKIIGNWTINYTHFEVMEILQKAGVAAIPCFNAEELFNNPHLNYRECWAQIKHPIAGEMATLAPSWKLSQTPAKIDSPAPLFGQHTSHVLKELLSLTDENIRQLEEEQVIY